MKVLVTGSSGFIGKNHIVRLRELSTFEVLPFDREDPSAALEVAVGQADAIVHLAGVNRPKEPREFAEGNAELTSHLCSLVESRGRHVPLLLTSSIQAELDNPYGTSKRAAESAVTELAQKTGNPVVVYRLPNVFGKWCLPNYNSVVATFCHNVANDLPINVHDAGTKLCLVYIDDVISEFVRALNDATPGVRMGAVEPTYEITLGQLAAQIEAFKHSRDTLVTERVGQGHVRALYATYVSYLPPAKFSYQLPKYGDERGVFVEMLKTPDTGQFSFFTAKPGVTRGGHYHHSKTEKFLVIKGRACFGFRHVLTNERYELLTSGDQPQVVETVPGWTHDVTNVGDEDLVVMLWANEIFDRSCPDTISAKV